jgi:hypothetical protein
MKYALFVSNEDGSFYGIEITLEDFYIKKGYKKLRTFDSYEECKEHIERYS